MSQRIKINQCNDCPFLLFYDGVIFSSHEYCSLKERVYDNGAKDEINTVDCKVIEKNLIDKNCPLINDVFIFSISEQCEIEEDENK